MPGLRAVVWVIFNHVRVLERAGQEFLVSILFIAHGREWFRDGKTWKYKHDT